MENVYEYKMRPNRKVTWFAAACIGFLLGYGYLTSDPRILAVVWALIAMCLVWLLMKSPTAGIRVDEQALTLSAWRNPRPVPLDEIEYLEVQHWTEDSDVKLVLRDGTEEMIPFGDLPDMTTFSAVMVDFGIRLLDPNQALSR